MKINTNYLLMFAALVGVVMIVRSKKARAVQNIVRPSVSDLEQNSFDGSVYDPAGMYKGVF